MAEQRLGQRRQHRGRHGRRWAGVLAVGLLIVSCGGEPRIATDLGGGPTGPPGVGGGGGSSGGPIDGPLVGTWRNRLLIQVGADVQRIETTWVFDTQARCSRTVETFSVLEDRLHFSVRPCSYQPGPQEIDVLYDDAQETVTFQYSFPDFNQDLLLIDEFEFYRLF